MNLMVVTPYNVRVITAYEHTLPPQVTFDGMRPIFALIVPFISMNNGSFTFVSDGNLYLSAK